MRGFVSVICVLLIIPLMGFARGDKEALIGLKVQIHKTKAKKQEHDATNNVKSFDAEVRKDSNATIVIKKRDDLFKKNAKEKKENLKTNTGFRACQDVKPDKEVKRCENCTTSSAMGMGMGIGPEAIKELQKNIQLANEQDENELELLQMAAKKSLEYAKKNSSSIEVLIDCLVGSDKSRYMKNDCANKINNYKVKIRIARPKLRHHLAMSKKGKNFSWNYMTKAVFQDEEEKTSKKEIIKKIYRLNNIEMKTDEKILAFEQKLNIKKMEPVNLRPKKSIEQIELAKIIAASTAREISYNRKWKKK